MLIDEANNRGGKDNITVVLVEAQEDPAGNVLVPASQATLAPQTARPGNSLRKPQ